MQYSQELVLQNNRECLKRGEISAYCMDDPATLDDVKDELKRLMVCYTYTDARTGRKYSKQSDEFWLELGNIIIEAHWSRRQLHDAITRHLTSCEYQTFTIANIMGFDKTIKTYTNDEIYAMKGQYPHKDFVKVVTCIDHEIVNVSIDTYNRYKYTEDELDMMAKSKVVHRFGFVKFDKEKHKKYLNK